MGPGDLRHQSGTKLDAPDRREPAGSVDHRVEDPTRRVEAVVFALLPEYHQVKVRDSDGRVYALTRKTAGVDLSELREGQHVMCTVTRTLPRVVSAVVLQC